MHGRTQSQRARPKRVCDYDLKPGDMLGFSACNLSGAIINLTTRGIPGWGLSHVAIVCGRPPQDGPYAGDLLVCESTTLYRSPCVFEQDEVSGVQFHYVRPRVRTYCGRVWRYPLARPLSPEESLQLTGYCMGLRGKSYDWRGAIDARDLLWGRIRRLICASLGKARREQAMHYLFCSELVAGALDDVGRFATLHPDFWSPNSLARAGIDRGTFQRPVRIK